MSTDSPKLTFFIGCTGCGKGALGRTLAQHTGAEIVSIDSMKVYRRMDVGTAKPPAEDRRKVAHHMIDMVEPSEEFSVAQYVTAADAAIRDIHARGKPVFVVGGTPLYVKSLTEGLFDGPGADPDVRSRLHEVAEREGWDVLYGRLERVDPVAAGRIHRNDQRRIVRALEVHELTGTPISELQTQWDRQRVRYDCTFIGLRRDRTDQNSRTNSRVKRMMDAGLVSEVRNLLAEAEPLGTAARQAVGYAEIIRHLAGELPLEEAVELIKINTRQLAKAQRTWFKRFRDTEWIDLVPDSRVEDVADELMKRRGSLWSA